VGFRWSAARAAADLGLRGYVRNAADGSVELCVRGSEKDVASLVTSLRRRFDVTEIDEWPAPAGEFTDHFEIRR
jgi:acylphosphatase